MNLWEILIGLATIAIAFVSALIATKKTEATMLERTNNIESNLDKHIEAHNTEMASLKSDIAALVNNYRSSSVERIEFILDYIKRVESNKADNSRVDIVITNIQRLEDKVDKIMDFLVMRDGKQ